MKAIHNISEFFTGLASGRRGLAVAAVACALLAGGTAAAENRKSQPEEQFSHYLARAVQIWSQAMSFEADAAATEPGEFFGRSAQRKAGARVHLSYNEDGQSDDHSSDDNASKDDDKSHDGKSDDGSSKDDDKSHDGKSDDGSSKDDDKSHDGKSDDKGSKDDGKSRDDSSTDDDSSDDVSKDRKAGCLPNLQVTFLPDLLHVSIISDKKIKSVILLFDDGSTQAVNKPKGRRGVFAGQGEKAGMRLTGVWVRSGCNYKTQDTSVPCPAEEDDGSSEDARSDDGSSDDDSSDDGSMDKQVKKCGEFFENEMAKVEVPVISIAGDSAWEGSDFGSTLEFEVTLSEPVPAGQTVEVAFTTVDGTATTAEPGPFDYVAGAGILLFNSGDFMQIISIQTIGDDDIEDDETFEVVLSDPSDNARLGSNRATGVILNDDDKDE